MKTLFLSLLILLFLGGCRSLFSLPVQTLKTAAVAIETTGKIVETTGKVVIAGSKTVCKAADLAGTALKTPGVKEVIVEAITP
ncbi:MAG: hypothetical protein ABIH08_05410 [Candidatus Omnitrophota bacterium]